MVLAAAIKRYRPHIRRLARALADGDVHLYHELDQQGCLKLWQLGADEIASRTPRHVRNTLSLRIAREFTRASRDILV